MSFELILPFLRPIEPLLLDDSISEIMGNPDTSWWYERDGVIQRERTISFEPSKLRIGLEVIANHLGKKRMRTIQFYTFNCRMGVGLLPSSLRSFSRRLR